MTAPALFTEPTAAGEQALIPGVAAITTRERIAAEAAKPMRGGEAPPPAGGLFDTGAQAQIDLLDAIPVAKREDAADARFVDPRAALADAERTGFHADLVAECKT